MQRPSSTSPEPPLSISPRAAVVFLCSFTHRLLEVRFPSCRCLNCLPPLHAVLSHNPLFSPVVHQAASYFPPTILDLLHSSSTLPIHTSQFIRPLGYRELSQRLDECSASIGSGFRHQHHCQIPSRLIHCMQRKKATVLAVEGDVMSTSDSTPLPNSRRRRWQHTFTGPSTADALSGGDDNFPTNFHLPSRRSVRRRLSAHPIDFPRPDSVTAARSRRKHKACMLASSRKSSSSTSHAFLAPSTKHHPKAHS